MCIALWRSSIMRGLRSMALGAGLFAALIAADANAAGGQTYFGSLYPEPPGIRPPPYLKWVASPNLKQVEAAMPETAKNAGRTQWSCAIADDGLLHDCHLNAEWPEREGVGEAARSLLPFFRLSDETVRYARLNNAEALFEIDLYNETYDRSTEIVKNCPEPFCVPMEMPPK
jgi:hypothetical protein